METPRVILVLGPTASGKSSLALQLAQDLNGRAQVVSADSMQIYRGMDIGTAKATAAQRAQLPHHMIDIVDPRADGFSVENWREGALSAISTINAAGDCAIIVGGTNLYIQALLFGLFDGPGEDAALREELRSLSLSELRSRLLELDPVSAQRIHANDQRRMIRAIEVTQSKGTPLSQLQLQWSATVPALPEGWRCVGLLPDSQSNAKSINQRVREMMAQGFLEEVRTLIDAGPLGRQAAEAVGYRELGLHLRGQLRIDDAIETTKGRTRRLARQQRTWLKRFRLIDGSSWITEPSETIAAEKISRVFLAR